MTPKEIFDLRKHGQIDDAYEAARILYATDKGAYASAAMFWTAVDILRLRINKGRTEEAGKILKALERLLPNVPDREGWVHDAFEKCRDLMDKGEKRHLRTENGTVNILMGTWGEELAAAYLREKGYIILERDWHSGHRDIDIIAKNDEFLVFVEVKTRQYQDYGSPVTAVDHRKQQNLIKAINHFLHYRHIELPWRFDVISVVGTPEQEPIIEHIEDFQLSRFIKVR